MITSDVTIGGRVNSFWVDYVDPVGFFPVFTKANYASVLSVRKSEIRTVYHDVGVC